MEFIIAWYVILMLFLMSVYLILVLQINKIFPYLAYRLEEFNYFYIKWFYDNKKDIYKIEDYYEVIFGDKKKFIEWKHHTITDLKNFLSIIDDNMRYVEQLLWKEIYNRKIVRDEKEIFVWTIKICKIKSIIRQLIWVLTIWVWFILLNWRKGC